VDCPGFLKENVGCAADMPNPWITLGFCRKMLVVLRTWQNPGLPWVFEGKCWLCLGHDKPEDYPGVLAENFGCALNMAKPRITPGFDRNRWLCHGHGKTQDYPGILKENVGCGPDMPKPWITLGF